MLLAEGGGNLSSLSPPQTNLVAEFSNSKLDKGKPYVKGVL